MYGLLICLAMFGSHELSLHRTGTMNQRRQRPTGKKCLLMYQKRTWCSPSRALQSLWTEFGISQWIACLWWWHLHQMANRNTLPFFFRCFIKPPCLRPSNPPARTTSTMPPVHIMHTLTINFPRKGTNNFILDFLHFSTELIQEGSLKLTETTNSIVIYLRESIWLT